MKQKKKKYILVADRVYEIRRVSFFYKAVEAVETDLTVADVPKNEVHDISEFTNCKVTLVNNSGQGNDIDFNSWQGRHNFFKRISQ